MECNFLANKRNMQIEGLRGIAIFIIVLYHVFYRYLEIYIGQPVIFMSFWGMLGTNIFLVISGFFSIKYSSVNEVQHNAARHLFDKIIRVWPTYFLSIVIIFVATHIWYLPGRTVGFIDLFMNNF